MAAVCLVILLFGTHRMASEAVVPDDDAAGRHAAAILDRLETRSAGLRDFSARVQARVSLPLLPSLLLHGHVYFKRPRRVHVDLDNLPHFAEGYRREFGALAPSARNRQDYVVRAAPDQTIQGRPCAVVSLTPRRRSNVRRVTMWIDQATLTVPRAILQYANGTVLTTRTRYTPVGAYMLPDLQKMAFALPAFTGQALVTYSHYQVNRGLPDRLFDKKGSATRTPGS